MVEVLASGLSDEDAIAVEKEMVRRHGTFVPAGYNMTAGGEGNAHWNADHGANISAAWKRPESRERHMAWRTRERLTEQANSEEVWMRQQEAWLRKRMQVALSMPVMDAIKMLAYRTKKAVQQAKRMRRENARLDWIVRQRDVQIEEVCKVAGIPVPPASSWAQSSTAYEREMGQKRGWNAR